MKKVLLAIALLVATSCSLRAQQSVNYVVAGGGAFDYYGQKAFYGWVAAAIALTERNFSWTCVDFGKREATVKTGYGYLVYSDDNNGLLFVVDAGPSVNSQEWGAAASGGFMYTRMIKGGFGVGFGVRFMKSTTTPGVQPILGFGIGKAL